jgi:metal-responsive CopG/Arc/MetJ family transcriptional regulator
MHVKLPEQLGDMVEEVYEEQGYSSKSEFVKDSVRRRVEEIN